MATVRGDLSPDLRRAARPEPSHCDVPPGDQKLALRRASRRGEGSDRVRVVDSENYCWWNLGGGTTPHASRKSAGRRGLRAAARTRSSAKPWTAHRDEPLVRHRDRARRSTDSLLAGRQLVHEFEDEISSVGRLRVSAVRDSNSNYVILIWSTPRPCPSSCSSNLLPPPARSACDEHRPGRDPMATNSIDVPRPRLPKTFRTKVAASSTRCRALVDRHSHRRRWCK